MVGSRLTSQPLPKFPCDRKSLNTSVHRHSLHTAIITVFLCVASSILNAFGTRSVSNSACKEDLVQQAPYFHREIFRLLPCIRRMAVMVIGIPADLFLPFDILGT